MQKLYDQCLSDDLYLPMNDSKVKEIIRRMLNVADNKPIIISAPVYLLAILQKKHALLILTSGGTQLIISNFRGFISKSLGTVLFTKLLAVVSTLIIVSSLPLILTTLIYAHSHIDCTIEPYLDILYKDDAEKKSNKGVKKLTPSLISQSKDIFLHEMIDSNY